MKRSLLIFFLWVSLLYGVFCESSLPVLSSDCTVALPLGFQAPARRSLLSDAHNAKKVETVLMAGLDGRVYLLDDQSFEPIWSFSSGGEIYSSYQAPHLYDKENISSIEGNYYIDIGDNWNLYAHHSLGPPQKLMESVEDFVSSTPHILEDGRIVIGSKTSSVFLIDGITGRIIKKCEFSDHQHKANKFPLEATVTQHHQSETELTLPIYFTRTDYRLESFMPLSSDKILWNVSVAQIKASFLCQGTEESFEVTHQNAKYVESGLTYNMPLSCQSQAILYHLRKHNVLEFLRAPYALPKANQQDSMLPSSNSVAPPPQPNVGKLIDRVGQSLRLDFQDAQNSSGQAAFIPEYKHTKSSGVHLSILVAIVLSVVPFLLQLKFPTRSPDTNAMALHSKKKRPRKPGKGGNKTGKQDKEENEINYTYKESENNFWANLDQPICYGSAGQRIGKLFVSSEVIGKGSNGTIVLEGIYQGRPVAVKRLVRAHNEIALKEIQNLIASDHHPNIINWYGVEEDKDFVYLALERCTCSLNDLIIMCMKASGIATLSEAEVASESMLGLNCRNGFKQTDLWKSNGYPSSSLLKLMRDVIAGIAHLHEIGIVHRDLKPQNVLITNERSLCAKVSDMGISKCLIGDVSSFGSHATGSGSSGWQAPEQLLKERQTRAVDMFSLGCVLFFCITGGKHPFGGHLERDSNIVKNKFDLFLIEYIPEAVDLFLRLLHPDAEMRPKAVEVLCHPLFWNAEMRLSFLRDTSDRVELEDREASSELLQELECIAPVALGAKWDEKLDPSFLNNIGRYRRYNYDSVRDLLRVMRNKLSHYRELPTEIQEVIGPVPEGFDRYFTSRFPKLLIEVYKVMLTHCRTEELFAKYFECIKE